MPLKNRDSLIQNLDWVTVLFYLILVVFGLLNITSATYTIEKGFDFSFSSRYVKQFVWIAVTLVLMLAILVTDTRFFSFSAIIFYIITLFALVAILGIGSVTHGAKAWVVIGSQKLQPSEFSKIFTALYLSKVLSDRNFDFQNVKNVMKAALIIILPILIILFQNDTGSALVYASFVLVLYKYGTNVMILILGSIALLLSFLTLIFSPFLLLILTVVIFLGIHFYYERNLRVTLFVMVGLFIALIIFNSISDLLAFDVKLYYVLLFVVVTSSGLFLIIGFLKNNKLISNLAIVSLLFLLIPPAVKISYEVVLQPHQKDRIEVFLNQKEDPQKTNYNVNQSKIAIGSGGFWGKGYLKGTQTQMKFVPEQETDFIFCTIGEEWGFIGSFLFVVLYLCFMIRIILLAERQRDRFSKLYGYCVFALFFFHFTINVGMTLGLIPVIGIPLPFISYGGSSFIAFSMMLFIFLNMDANRMKFLENVR